MILPNTKIVTAEKNAPFLMFLFSFTEAPNAVKTESDITKLYATYKIAETITANEEPFPISVICVI